MGNWRFRVKKYYPKIFILGTPLEITYTTFLKLQNGKWEGNFEIGIIKLPRVLLNCKPHPANEGFNEFSLRDHDQSSVNEEVNRLKLHEYDRVSTNAGYQNLPFLNAITASWTEGLGMRNSENETSTYKESSKKPSGLIWNSVHISHIFKFIILGVS